MAKTVLISGASRGIGRAAALCFAKSGYKIAAGYNSTRAQIDSLMAEFMHLGTMAVPVKGDISSPEAATHMVEQAVASLGGVDVLINNAGIDHYGLFEEMAPEEWQKLMSVDLSGAYNLTRAALPYMRRRNGSAIINVASVHGIYGASCEAAYSAAKAGLIGLTKALAKELGPSGIRVNCVAPGVIETDMMARFTLEDKRALIERTPLMRLGTPDDVARAMLFLAGDDAAFITGQVLEVSGGFPC